MSKRITALYWLLYFAFMFMPFIAVLVVGVPFDKPVNVTYIGAFITANGVFLGILTAALITRSDVLEANLTFEIRLDLVYFAGALFVVFQSALLGEPKVSHLTALMSSLMADIGTAITVTKRLRFENA